MLLPADLSHLIQAYGAWLVAGVVGLESVGVPLPGETTLISAALYAGATHHLNIVVVVVAGAAGAIAGDNIGYLIGRHLGSGWLVRHGSLLHLTERRLKLGQYLFHRHGGKVVFFGRFVALLRAVAAFLAGINCMQWMRFLLFNAAGGTVWAFGYGFAAYFFGQQIVHLIGPIGIAIGVAAAVIVVAAVLFVRRNEHRLEEEAEHAFPGPLRR
ncbi:MAG TPA: DedA family protein [Vicinamibacterales bacterium]